MLMRSSKSLQKSFSSLAAEHFSSSTFGIYPIENDSAIAIVLVANKYSPNNFWNGRYRSTYILKPSSSLSGVIRVDVHYYEDGNVRLQTDKKVAFGSAPESAREVAREIAKAENKYQTELNRGFNDLSEGAFKGLRRQLPVTRQRVEWEKIGGYRVSEECRYRCSMLLCLCYSLGLTCGLAGTGHRWWTKPVESGSLAVFNA